MEKPDVFERGCEDPTAHEQYIEELKAEGEKLLLEASHAFSIADLRIDLHPGGAAHVWFALSDDKVPAFPPGDTRGPSGLVAWLEANPEAAAKL